MLASCCVATFSLIPEPTIKSSGDQGLLRLRDASGFDKSARDWTVSVSSGIGLLLTARRRNGPKFNVRSRAESGSVEQPTANHRTNANPINRDTFKSSMFPS
jgi:hypothetical protein